MTDSLRRGLVALPPLVGLALVALYLAVETARPGTFTAPRPETIAEAIVVGNGGRTVEMIGEGFDLNARGRVRAGLLDRAEYHVTPLEAALLARRIEVVRLLMTMGADVSRSTRAACLARTRLPEALAVMGFEAPDPSAAGSPDCFAP